MKINENHSSGLPNAEKYGGLDLSYIQIETEILV